MTFTEHLNKAKTKRVAQRESLMKLGIWQRFTIRCKELLLFAFVLFLVKLLLILLFGSVNAGILRVLSDCFFIPGLGLTAWGLIVLGGYSGALDGLAYSVKRTISLFSVNADSLEEREKRSQSFSEFAAARKLTRVSPLPYFAVGVPALIISFLFVMLD